MPNTVGTPDWSTIPAPHDDGATDHLPTFEVSGMTLLKRFTLVISGGTVEHVFYPVFPPDRSAGDVIDCLAHRT
jgi:hypothetical protein